MPALHQHLRAMRSLPNAMEKNTSEIAKLTERISQDPKSKLFVPLAEEYKKAGDMEMAIHVLTEGLKNNPAYVTARSFLGKLLIERGDLPGAQKEFEEVVKVIPDNLLAHRKLGDLYALQGRSADALTHYKTALSLNPRDQETAMLISEVEAGRDIKMHLGMQKPAETDQPRAAKAEAAPVPPAAPAESVESRHETEHRSEPAEPPSDFLAAEEPEDILMVEPLEEAISSPPVPEAALPAENMNFLTEAGQDIGVAPPQKEEIGLFSDDNPFGISDSAVQIQEPLSQTENFQEAAPEFAEDHGKQTDDFTTDTLAELYISQGFFEKAIEIYERMLVDNPTSQGLKDKLANVRAQAAAAPAGEQGSEPDTLSDTAFMDEPGSALSAGTIGEGFGQPESGAEPPRLDEWELTETRAVPPPGGETRHRPQKAGSPVPGNFETGFEPKEYIPPDAVMKPDHNAPAADFSEPGNEDQAAGLSAVKRPGPKKHAAGSKQETVERLESWLKNIKKER